MEPEVTIGPWVSCDKHVVRAIVIPPNTEPGGNWFDAYAWNLPGSAGQGPTVEEALKDLEHGIYHLLLSYRADKRSPPWTMHKHEDDEELLHNGAFERVFTMKGPRS